jgi:hypothetical protein
VERSLKRKLAIGATGVAVLAGASGTYAATRGGDDERDAYLGDVAKRLGVSRADLSSALRGAFFDRLDAVVAAGRLTQEQADRIKKDVREHGDAPLPFGGPPHLERGRGPGFGPPGLGIPGPGLDHRGPVFGGFDAAADYLGLTDAQLRRKLENGKSLADVARDENKSVDGLERAIEDGVRKSLDDAVKDKRITGEMRDKILDGLDARIDDLVRMKPGKDRWDHRPGLHRHRDWL